MSKTFGRFLGTNNELKQFLKLNLVYFKSMLEEDSTSLTEGDVEKIKSIVDFISIALESNLLNTPEEIDSIALENIARRRRNELNEKLVCEKPRVDEQRLKMLTLLHSEGGALPDYEYGYYSEEQTRLRTFIARYQEMEAERKKEKRELKSLNYLLIALNAPLYFTEVIIKK